jgi:hypothetical protein
MEGNGGPPAGRSMVWLFGEMFLVPIRTFIFGLERLLETMIGMQHAGDRGMGVMAGGPPAGEVKAEDTAAITPPMTVSIESEQGAAGGGTEIATEEIKRMDKDLNDDMLKLVRYKVLFVKREYEYAFDEEEALVSDNMDGSAFTAWKIAEFIQKLGRQKGGNIPRPISVPGTWKNYPDDKDEHGKLLYREDGKLTGFPEGDKKYLRVFYEVLERYSREKFKYEEEEINVLKDIRDTMKQQQQQQTKPTQ